MQSTTTKFMYIIKNGNMHSIIVLIIPDELSPDKFTKSSQTKFGRNFVWETQLTPRQSTVSCIVTYIRIVQEGEGLRMSCTI